MSDHEEDSHSSLGEEIAGALVFGVVGAVILGALAFDADRSQYHWEAFKYNISHPFTDGSQAISDYIAQVHKQNESQTYLEMDIDDLLDAYDANINTATSRYQGKFVKITYAHVHEIGTNSIEFQGDGDNRFSFVVSWNINRHDQQVRSDISKLEKDDYVTVYGKIDDTTKGAGTCVEILIDHIVPTPVTAEQLIQRASDRAMKKLKKK